MIRDILLKTSVLSAVVFTAGPAFAMDPENASSQQQEDRPTQAAPQPVLAPLQVRAFRMAVDAKVEGDSEGLAAAAAASRQAATGLNLITSAVNAGGENPLGPLLSLAASQPIDTPSDVTARFSQLKVVLPTVEVTVADFSRLSDELRVRADAFAQLADLNANPQVFAQKLIALGAAKEEENQREQDQVKAALESQVASASQQASQFQSQLEEAKRELENLKQQLAAATQQSEEQPAENTDQPVEGNY